MTDCIGKLKVSNQEAIVVSLSEWKGEKGIDIRKYLDTEKYSGPTKQGVRIHNKGIKSIIKVLGKVNIEDKFVDNQVIGFVAKDVDHDIVVKISLFTGTPKVDLRERINSKSGEYFTKKGVTIPFSIIQNLRDLLQEATWAHDNN